MAWWVKNHIAVNDDETKQLCSIEADTQTSLPAADQTATAGFIIVRGSDALVVDTGDRYIMNSAGTWIRQPAGVQLDLTGYATTQDLADGLAEKVDTTTYMAGQAAQDNLINYTINTGAKNLLKYNGYASGATNGVTYTINTDGTMTVSGTPQGTSPSYIEIQLNGNAVNISQFCDGLHILSGCPAGGSDSTYRMYAARGGYSRFDYGDGVLLTETALTDVRLVIYIYNGYTANNLVFKPMIRRADITDNTYQPYAPTNRELYEMLLALQ